MPDLSLELAAGAPALRVAGIDEVGRGPLAGPVLAAAVILPEAGLPMSLADAIDDCKLLRPQRRRELCEEILARCAVGLGSADVAEIDRLNILHASHLAMARAAAALPVAPAFALVDGHLLPPGLALPARAVIGGDRRSLSIAAASIVAKVARDRFMAELARLHPGYGWERNAGYPTPEHLAALDRLGPTPQHRRSFAPVGRRLGHPAGD